VFRFVLISVVSWFLFSLCPNVVSFDLGQYFPVTTIAIDKFRDECGVFGIYGHAESARLAYLGLYALQHRGQESCGIVSSDGRETMPQDSCPRCCSA